MYQNIKVNSVADKVASNNKPYKALEVQDEAGAVFKVNIFNDFPDFANVAVGSVLRGQLVQKGQYTNLLSETQSRGNFKPNGGYKTQQIEKIMDRKDNSIGKFQDNKEWSIMTASSMSNAVALAIAEVKQDPLLDLAESISKWRRYIITNWEVDPKDYPPF